MTAVLRPRVVIIIRRTHALLVIDAMVGTADGVVGLGSAVQLNATNTSAATIPRVDILDNPI